ncbi:MAG: hypothetical protein KDA63_13005 [Planctomycetales bacterium]|nr:hypothetical protein [Planctomycetales bacterium]
MSTRLDVLVEAAQSENWTEVRRCAEAITRVDLPRACAELASSAAQLCEQIARPASRRDVQLSLAKLIGAGASALEVARTCQHDDVAE